MQIFLKGAQLAFGAGLFFLRGSVQSITGHYLASLDPTHLMSLGGVLSRVTGTTENAPLTRQEEGP